MHKPNPISLAAKASGEPEFREVGVGPWTQEHPGEPRPDDPKSPNYDRRYDTTLLDEGDRRNVLDRYRYWTVNAIRDDLDAAGRHGFEVAIENWTHDFNIGSMVRTANAFTANRVHIVGPHKWNRKGSLMTELYQHVEYHPSIDELVTCWKLRIAGEIAAALAQAAAAAMHSHQAHSDASALLSDDDESNGSPRFASATDHSGYDAVARADARIRTLESSRIIALDIIPGAVPMETYRFPERCLMLFGAEGPGLSNKALELADDEVYISQFGSVLDNASFTAEDDKVTGFLGSHGAGKSTTMRAALGLVTPNAGRALVDAVPFVKTPSPMTAVGAVLDAKSAHKGRSAYTHLRGLALTNGIPRSRVDEVIEFTGLASVEKRNAGAVSPGRAVRCCWART